MSDARAPTLASVVDAAQVVLCAGPGGVGKTTTAAAIAVEGARAGRRACVVTIDPAKRLADALGIGSLTNDPHRIDGAWAGQLFALMLDTKSTFDEVVTRNATSAEQADAILANPLYRNIAGALSGTQEYMAMEKLYELTESGRFDLVVVDTPPTRNALDFLDAPGRLTRFLNNRVFRLLMTPTRAGLKAVNVAAQLLLRTVSRVVGGEVVTDAIDFFSAFEGMEQGFRDRAAAVEALLGSERTSFVIVSAPRRDAAEEAAYFSDRLARQDIAVRALIVNRVFPRFPGLPDPAELATPAPDGPGSAHSSPSALLDALRSTVADLGTIAGEEERYVEELAGRSPDAAVARVPFLPSDVHDLDGLVRIADHLFGRRPPYEP